MGTTMDKAFCEWVRSRLPLCVGAGDTPGDPDDDGADLGIEDRGAVAYHLADCPDCRAHRAELAGALDALAATADAVPVAPDPSSLWPALQRRIAAHPPVGADPAQDRGGEPAADRAGSGSIWGALDDDRPLKAAWMRDTLKELAEAAGGAVRPSLAPGVSWRVVGSSLAASILAALVVVPVTWRLRDASEARMVANAVPVRALVGPPAPAVEVTATDAPAPKVDRDIPARELAQAEPIRPPADPAPAAAPTAPEPARGEPATSSRLGFDLEHGTPMPPDGRDAKPIY